MQNSAASRRTVGILIACGGVLAVSPDAMLLRWMRSLGASSPDVAMAKYIGIIICMLIIGSLKGVSGARVSCVHFVSSALAQLLYQLSFTFCLLLTDAAKALLLISLAPLWAAMFGVFVLHEQLPLKTMVALALSLVSVLLVFVPHILPPPILLANAPEQGRYALAGDALAVATGIFQGESAYLTLTLTLTGIIQGESVCTYQEATTSTHVLPRSHPSTHTGSRARRPTPTNTLSSHPCPNHLQAVALTQAHRSR